MKRRLLPIWFLIVALGAGTLAYGFGGGGRGHRSPKTDRKTKFEWPGRYQCEQCSGGHYDPMLGPPSTAAAQSQKTCWTYELTIMKYEDVLRGEVDVKGPGGDLDLKALVKTAEDHADFNFTEPVDPASAKVTFQRDDLLATLQRRDDDVLLRFQKIPSQIKEQEVITCAKQKSPGAPDAKSGDDRGATLSPALRGRSPNLAPQLDAKIPTPSI